MRSLQEIYLENNPYLEVLYPASHAVALVQISALNLVCSIVPLLPGN